MSEQRHVILRQVIEWSLADPGEAPAFQDELSRIYQQRILPLIERCCSELAPPDRLYRIDRLELDLGAIDAGQLEEQFVARMEPALRAALSAQIERQEQEVAQAGSSPRALSALELFAAFVRSGSLPWWADAAQPNLLAENLGQLLRETPRELAGLLAALICEDGPCRRLTNQYDDEQLAAMAALLVPAFAAALPQDLPALIAGLPADKAAPRQRLWRHLLQVAAQGGPQYATPGDFYHAVLTRAAAELGQPLRPDQIPAALRAAASPPLQELLDELSRPPSAGLLPDELTRPGSAGRTDRPSGSAQAGSEELAQCLAELRAANPLPPALFARLELLAARLSAPLRAHWLAALPAARTSWSREGPATRRGASGDAGDAWAQVVSESLRRLLGEAAAQRELGPAECARLLAMLGTDGPQPAVVPPPALDLPAAADEPLAVDNAGLVILWPFLSPFFEHLGLLDEQRQFKDPPAQQRAVGLLQVIATRQAAPPEFRLPLNKLLCGLEPQQIFDFGAPLRRAETRACSKLLKAVIAQAPILHDMSVAGFTGSFLLRAGLLSPRDGHWLLRVERQTYDIVLERFPWSWQWLRLPWMETPLQVEW